MPKKMLWKMGTCSRLSERLIRDGRDSAKRVVSDTDTPKVLLEKGHKKNRPLCAPRDYFVSTWRRSSRKGRVGSLVVRLMEPIVVVWGSREFVTATVTINDLPDFMT